MTEHDAREVTTERRPGMDQLLLHAQGVVGCATV